MRPFTRLSTAVLLCAGCASAGAAPFTLVFSGTILTFNQDGAQAGNKGDPFSGKIVFDLGKVASAVQNDNGTIRATAGGSGGCSVYVDGACNTDTGPVPLLPILSGTVSTTLGEFTITPAQDGSLTSGYVSRVDGTANGGGQGAKYTMGNYNMRYDATASGYERTTLNQMIGVDLTADKAKMFADATYLGGSINVAALTSSLFTFSSTQIRAECTDVGLFSCRGGNYDGALPQVDLVGTIGAINVMTPGTVPEPGSLALLAAGAAALGLGQWRRRRA